MAFGIEDCPNWGHGMGVDCWSCGHELECPAYQEQVPEGAAGRNDIDWEEVGIPF